MHTAYTFLPQTEVELRSGEVTIRDDRDGLILYATPEDLLKMAYTIIEGLDPAGEYPDQQRCLNVEIEGEAACQKI